MFSFAKHALNYESTATRGQTDAGNGEIWRDIRDSAERDEPIALTPEMPVLPRMRLLLAVVVS
jgi:hypothetical protein